MDRLIHAARGALVGATQGVVCGLVDQLLRVLDPALAASPTATLAVALYWGVMWAGIGLVCGACFGRAHRWASAVTGGLAVLTLVGGYANLRWLPALFDPASLIFDAILVVAVSVVAVLAARREGPQRVRLRVSALLVVAVILGAALVSLRSPSRSGSQPGPGSQAGPDVLVVLLDALRADHCSAYGYGRETTPFLDRLATEGVLFERAYSVSSWTKPVVATLFSGLYPARHSNHAINAVLPPELVTLPEAFAAGGFRTAVFAENNFVSPLFGYDQGVDHFVGSDPAVYTQTLLGHVLGQVAVRLPALSPAVESARLLDALDPGQRRFSEDGIDLPGLVVDWVGGLADSERFFTYVHLLKPHAPYTVPDEFEGLWSGPGSENEVRPPHVEGIAPFAAAPVLDPARVGHLIDNYDERIRFGDDQLRQIVEGVRAQGRDPIVVVLSDHGEEFGENGLFDHGHSLQQGVVRVPLVVSWPGGLAGGQRIGSLCRLLDLPPTLLDWSGLPPVGEFDGQSLGAPGQLEDRPVLLELEHGRGFASQALLRDRLKLVVSEQGGRRAEQIFDLTQDPGEVESIAHAGEDPLVWMLEELESLRGALLGRGTVSGETSIDPGTEERLRALGYIR